MPTDPADHLAAARRQLIKGQECARLAENHLHPDLAVQTALEILTKSNSLALQHVLRAAGAKEQIPSEQALEALGKASRHDHTLTVILRELHKLADRVIALERTHGVARGDLDLPTWGDREREVDQARARD